MTRDYGMRVFVPRLEVSCLEVKNMNYTNKGNKPTKTGFGEGVLAAAQRDSNVVGLGADITNSVGMNLFAEAFPERFVSMGIAEQDAVATAAGLALSGKIPVFSTYGVFAAHRANDQIRVSVCYNNVHVVIGGAHAGVSVGPDGATHQALEDIAAMRVLPNMTVISPCDATQAKIATEKAILECKGRKHARSSPSRRRSRGSRASRPPPRRRPCRNRARPCRYCPPG